MKFAGRRLIGVVSDAGAAPEIEASRILPVESIYSGLPAITAEEIELWRFISHYYLCTVGEVYKAAYPSLKTASEESEAKSRRRRDLLQERTISLWQSKVEKLSGRLEAKDAELAGRHSESVMQRLSEQRAKIAEELEAASLRLASLSEDGLALPDWSKLLQDIPAVSGPVLTNQGRPVLLKGRDRNTYYMDAVAQTLRSGRNVFILVNETDLVPVLRQELEAAFGGLLLVHHSQITQAARRRIADDIRSGRPYVLIGTRSSIFLPHRDLGLIIVDNEQSPFYKQGDTAPRYNARDCAVKMSVIHSCPVILGTDSPSLESLYNEQTGRYFGISTAPAQGRHQEIFVDMKAEKRKNGVIGPFSRKLLQAIPKDGKTAIIRGFEKEEDVVSALAGLGMEGVSIFTIPSAAKTDLGSFDLIAMLSADALFDAGDFRSDERAFQYLERLRGCPAKLVIQSYQASHQVFSLKDASPLMGERKQFNLPPFSRLTDIHFASGIISQELEGSLQRNGFHPSELGGTIRITLPRDRSHMARKATLAGILSEFRARNPREHFTVDSDPA